MSRILVIDDDPGIRGMLTVALEQAGYEVLSCSNGREGLDCCSKVSIDVIITDIIMPDMEGIETIVELKKHSADSKIIAISGGGRLGPKGYLDTALKMGASFAFKKPFELEEILEAVRSLTA